MDLYLGHHTLSKKNILLNGSNLKHVKTKHFYMERTNIPKIFGSFWSFLPNSAGRYAQTSLRISMQYGKWNGPEAGCRFRGWHQKLGGFIEQHPKINGFVKVLTYWKRDLCNQFFGIAGMAIYICIYSRYGYMYGKISRTSSQPCFWRYSNLVHQSHYDLPNLIVVSPQCDVYFIFHMILILNYLDMLVGI